VTPERLQELIDEGESLSAAIYRRLGREVEYVRQRGFEPLQQEKLVEQYVDKHGRIVRKQVADLCQISGPQASRLLARLVERGVLARRGRRKGAFHERPSKYVDASKGVLNAFKRGPRARGGRRSR
jgi:ATP-dependent DNA helicase RecG